MDWTAPWSSSVSGDEPPVLHTDVGIQLLMLLPFNYIMHIAYVQCANPINVT